MKSGQIVVRGSQKAVDTVKRELDTVLSQIATDTCTVPTSADVNKEMLNSVEHENNVIIERYIVSSANGSAAAAAASGQNDMIGQYFVGISEQLQLRIVEADLTTFSSDAIVSTIDERGYPNTQLADTICKKGTLFRMYDSS